MKKRFIPSNKATQRIVFKFHRYIKKGILTWSEESATAPHRQMRGYIGNRKRSSLCGRVKNTSIHRYIGDKVNQYGRPRFCTAKCDQKEMIYSDFLILFWGRRRLYGLCNAQTIENICYSYHWISAAVPP